ncbi:hypothetical protein ACFXJ5_28485 [Streptomyces sp. NPDC059373]
MPEEITFATKPGPGIEMLCGAIECDLPFAWVAANADYRLRQGPHPAPSCTSVPCPTCLGVPVTPPVAGPPPRPYQRAVAQAGDLLHYAIVRDMPSTLWPGLLVMTRFAVV